MNELEVRHSHAADIEQIRLIYAEPSNYAATLQLPFPPPSLWEKRLGALADGSFSLVACRADEILGQLGIEVHKNPRRRHAAHLGMAVKASARRQGVGSALVAAAVDLAERWLAVRRIELEVYTDNVAAIGLYSKFGFVVEGTLKQYAFRNGVFVDVHVMSKIA
ncbi:MAG TPA: GNAT family N-acetyltransferase [Casimicrobiaceae bacterium]|jgi:putative acetyltransferase